MIDISEYDTKSGSSNNFSDEKCDRKHVFSEQSQNSKILEIVSVKNFQL